MINLTEEEIINNVANYMIKRHGKWAAIYHCLTLIINCAKASDKPRTFVDNPEDVRFWWEVRTVIHNKV